MKVPVIQNEVEGQILMKPCINISVSVPENCFRNENRETQTRFAVIRIIAKRFNRRRRFGFASQLPPGRKACSTELDPVSRHAPYIIQQLLKKPGDWLSASLIFRRFQRRRPRWSIAAVCVAERSIALPAHVSRSGSICPHDIKTVRSAHATRTVGLFPVVPIRHVARSKAAHEGGWHFFIEGNLFPV